jgi:Acetyltransferase (GNAT) domain
MAETSQLHDMPCSVANKNDSGAVWNEQLGVSAEADSASRLIAFEPQRSPRRNPAMAFTVLHDFPQPVLELAWRNLLRSVKVPSHYTAPEYFREPYFDGKCPFAILAMEGTTVAGVLTGFHVGNTVTCGLPTRPQVQINPAADTAAVVRAFVQGLEQESRGADLVSIYSWEWLPLDPILQHHYRRRVLEGNPVLDLKLGKETLLKQCGTKRVKIRYAIKHGVEVFPAETPEDYETFYKIYADWCASKNTPCFPYAIEERAFRTTLGNRRLFLARHSGKVIAGNVFRFFPGGLVECSRNSSLPECQSLRPNDLLMWRGIEWSCEQGFSLFSMGASHRFLREFGGPMIPIIRYRLDRTLFRRHDRREEITDAGRSFVGKLPPVWEKRIRRMIGKEQPAGW